MNPLDERDVRLRQLLRDGDPARDVPELGADEVARLRRVVIGGVEHETSTWWARPAFVFALAAAIAIVAVGPALWRLEAPRESAPTDRRAATSPATPQPRDQRAAEPVPDRVASATPSAHQPVLDRVTSAAPAAHQSAVTRPSAPATTALLGDIARRRSRRATQSSPRPAPVFPGSAPNETVIAAAPPSEPQQPYQLQLTAPGGTRIVWLLTSSSGR